MVMQTIQIIRAKSQDLSALQSISRTTFTQTFAEGNTEENLKRYLEFGFATEKLSKELKNPESEFYLALIEGHVIGYLKVNFGTAQSEEQNPQALEIERIYVMQEYQGKHVGLMLFEKALAIAQKRKSPYLWLGVWEKNQSAIQFYQKLGFVEFGQHIFQFGDEAQTDILMQKII